MSSRESRPKSQYGFLIFLALALVCAAFAAFIASNMMRARGYTGERVRPVVVAKIALAAAQPLTKDSLEVVNWPESSVPPGAAANVAELIKDEKFPPVLTTGILPGAPVLPARLSSPSQGVGLAAVVEVGKRGVSVKVDDTVARSGLVYPGARVDVLATIRDPGGLGPSTRIAVSNVKVLAVESQTDVATRKPQKEEGGGAMSGGSSSRSDTIVTLEVTPEDAEIVSLVVREGKIDLALRNGNDHSPTATLGATPSHFSAYATPPTSSSANAEITTAGRLPRPAPTRGGAKGRIVLRSASGEGTKPPETNSRIETYNAR